MMIKIYQNPKKIPENKFKNICRRCSATMNGPGTYGHKDNKLRWRCFKCGYEKVHK